MKQKYVLWNEHKKHVLNLCQSVPLITVIISSDRSDRQLYCQFWLHSSWNVQLQLILRLQLKRHAYTMQWKHRKSNFCYKSIYETMSQRHKPVARKIHLWNKTDFDKVRESATTMTADFLAACNADTPIDTMWNTIKGKILQLMEDSVPSKLSSTRFSQPWITRSKTTGGKKEKMV